MPEQEETLLSTPQTWSYICGTPRHAKLQDWLRTHDIDPKNVPIHDPVSVITDPDGAQVIQYSEFLRDADGRRYVDPARHNEAATVMRHVPLRTPPPRPKRSDITTRALLQAIHDHATRPVPPGKYRWELPGAWWTLCTVYPEKVVTAAYIREDDRGHLDCGVSLRTSWLTDKGHAELARLKEGPGV